MKNTIFLAIAFCTAAGFGQSVVSDGNALVPMTMRPERGFWLAWDADVPDNGFYRLCLRRAGKFRWGSLTPSLTSVWVDGEEVRQFDATREKGGSDDEESVPLWLERGRHLVELRGEYVERYLVKHTEESPRIWIRRVATGTEAGDDESLCLTQAMPAESVFRKSEPIEWTVHRSTLAAKDAVEVEFRAVRQFGDPDAAGEPFAAAGDGVPCYVWREKVALAPGQAHATAKVAFPKELVGAFEYTVWQNGRLAEGPWEFLVVDAQSRAGDREITKSARLIDRVDFGSEPTGGVHRIRDNGTSRVAKLANGLSYRYGTWRITHVSGRKASDYDWFGCSLKVGAPGATHVAKFILPTDKWRRFPLELLDPATEGRGGSFVEIVREASPGTTEVMVPFWPNGEWEDFLFGPSTSQNDRRGGTEPAVAAIEVWEVPDGLPPMAAASGGWNAERHVVLGGEQPNLSPELWTTPPAALWPNHGNGVEQGLGERGFDYARWHTAWRRWGEFAAWQGVTDLEWPLNAYGMAHVRTASVPWGLDYWLGDVLKGRGFAKFRRNTLKIILLECERAGVRFWGDIQSNYNVGRAIARGDGTVAGVAKSPDGQRANAIQFIELVKRREGVTDDDLDGAFLYHTDYIGGCMNPSHPVARRFLVHVYGDIAEEAAKRGSKAFAGIIVRLWRNFSNGFAPWWVNSQSGYDDGTLSRFAADTGGAFGKLADMGATPEERKAWLLDDHVRRTAWFKWRADQCATLWQEVVAEVRKHLPDASIIPAPEGVVDAALGCGIDAAKMPEGSGFGLNTADIHVQGHECNALLPETFASFDTRGKEQKAACTADWREEGGAPKELKYPYGLCTASGLIAGPHTAKALAKAVAENGPADRLYLGKWWSQQLDTTALREAVRGFRAIPSGKWWRIAPPAEGIAVAGWTLSDGTAVFANASANPATVRLDTSVVDLVDGRGNPSELVLSPWGIRVVKAAREVKSYSLAAKRGAAAESLVFTVGNPGGAARKNVLSTMRLGEAMAMGCADFGSLRLYRGGIEKPMQIDRRDKDGFFLADEADAPRSPYDEIAFLADFAEGETEADFELRWGGDPAAAWPRAFAVETNAAPDKVRNWDMLVSRKSGEGGASAWAVGLRETGIGLLEMDGKTVMRPAKGGAFFGWLPDHGIDYRDAAGAKLTAKPGPLRVLSSGPVRLIAAYWWAEPVDIWSFPDQKNVQQKRAWGKSLRPIASGVRRQRAWEFVAGHPGVVSHHVMAWDKTLAEQIEARVWLSTAFKESGTPITEKTLVTGGKAYPGRDGRSGGGFSPARYGKEFTLWDNRLGVGYSMELHPDDVGGHGLEFGTFFACSLSAGRLTGGSGRCDCKVPITLLNKEPSK